MNKIIMAALSTAFVLVLVPIAFAKNPGVTTTCVPVASIVTAPEDRTIIPQARYFDGTYNLGVLQRRLRLSGEQKREMQLLYTGFQDSTRDTRRNLASRLKEKKDMLRSGKIDEKELAQLDDQIVKLRSDMFRDRLKLVRDRLGLLTPDQTHRLARLKERTVCHANLRRIHKSAKG